MSVCLSAPRGPVLVSTLPLPDRLVIWAIRAWVIGPKRRLDTAEPMRAAFGKYGIPEAAYLIDGLMSVVACGALRPLTVECVCHDPISDDERVLLAAAALHQDGRGFEARFLLRTMLSPTASNGAGEILDRLGALLADAGLTLFRWPPRTERYVLGPAPKAGHEATSSRPTLH
ncbi:MAG: hypothetical protein AB7H90_09025 [Alphaproteobacteria bacterium]